MIPSVSGDKGWKHVGSNPYCEDTFKDMPKKVIKSNLYLCRSGMSNQSSLLTRLEKNRCQLALTIAELLNFSIGA